MKKLVIFGLKNYAEIVHYYFTHDSDYAVAAFSVDGAYLKETTFEGLPVVPFEEVDRHFPPTEHDVFVAVGIAGVNSRRAAKVVEAAAKGYQLASFISSKADIPYGFEAGPNSAVMERVQIMPRVTIGQNTVIWNRTLLSYDTHVGDHCWIVACTLGEKVFVGDNTFIGINATVSSTVTVGKRNIIGAGALIMRDTQDDEVYRGDASTASKVPSGRLWSFGR